MSALKEVSLIATELLGKCIELQAFHAISRLLFMVAVNATHCGISLAYTADNASLKWPTSRSVALPGASKSALGERGREKNGTGRGRNRKET